MKVAILGAGLADLACANELQKHGINPTIYEAGSSIGEQYPHVGAAIVTRPSSS